MRRPKTPRDSMVIAFAMLSFRLLIPDETCVAQILPSFPMPVLVPPKAFVYTQAFGPGTVTLPGQTEPATLHPGLSSVFAAAYYKDAGVLVAVDESGAVRVYRRGNATFELSQMKSPWPRSKVEAVHFSRLPGLLYVLTIDLEKKEANEKGLRGTPIPGQPGKRRMRLTQDYPDNFERVDFSSTPNHYEAIPFSGQVDKVTILDMVYVALGSDSSSDVVMALPDGREIILKMSSRLAPPYRWGPSDTLAEAVYIFPENGIVSKTTGGWAVHDLNGKLKKEFSTDGIRALWWEGPMMHDGTIYVTARTGPGGTSYKLDVRSGEMVHAEIPAGALRDAK
jgi:hypothetical protein